MNRVYFCIDLKTFYASVECVERGLDPFKTDLVVADIKRSKNTICLAISPHMKMRGIKNRCRMWEIPYNIHPIIAKPRMKKYIEYSALIYSIYLKYISPNDIHPYSIDEMFLDVTSYLKLYQKSPIELAHTIMNDIYETTGITATAGIGTNLYLAKVALDIISKKSRTNIGYLDEALYKKQLWHHTPLTDFWRIGTGIEERLNKHHIKDMYDIAHTDPMILYKEFGINAEFLIDHALGIEPCTIKEIKEYKPKSNSISNNQILSEDYNYENARIVLIEMIDNLVLQLVSMNKCTDHVGFYIGYSKSEIKSLKVSLKINQSSSFKNISALLLKEYDFRINKQYKIRRIGIWFNNIHIKKYEQLDLFNKNKKEDTKIESVMNDIKNKYGKNSILRAISYQEKATARIRNNLIGGHNAQ